jgi:hypothetical protein
MHCSRVCLGIVVFVCAITQAFAAHSGEDKKPPLPDPEKPRQEAKDPTEMSAKMRQALKKTENRAEVVAAEPAPAKLPDITLKGLVKSKEGSAAMIELQGAGLRVVREGSELNADNMQLIVRKITADTVEIEIPERKKTIVLR